MSEPKIMKLLHSIREANYEKMRNLSIKEQIIAIQAGADPIKKRLIEKMKKKDILATAK